MNQGDAGTIGRICTVAKLVYLVTGIGSHALDLAGNQIFEIPKGHSDERFCQLLTKVIGTCPDSDYHFKRCKNACDLDDYMIHSCPYGLLNVIIPVRSESKLAGILEVGPIMTTDPKDIVENHILPKTKISQIDIVLLKDFLSGVEQRDINFVNSLSQTISMLLNSDFSDPYTSLALFEELEENDTSNENNLDIIDAALRFISKHYMEDISLDDVARSVSLHPARLSRLLNQYTNCNFRKHINRLRIAKAKQLLLDLTLSVVTVCHQIGFSDQSYFDKVFKTMTGVTPSQFRKANTSKYWETASIDVSKAVTSGRLT